MKRAMAEERQIPVDAVKLGLWQSFRARHCVAATAVPLFEADGGRVVTRAQVVDDGL